MAAALVAQLGQLHRVALAGHEGPDNSQAGHAGDVADDVLELDVHLRQGLLHVLDVLAGIRYEHLALPQVAAQDAHRLVGPEGGGQEAVAVQPLQPLAVVDVALGSAGDASHLAGIDQPHLQAAALQKLKEGDPEDAGGFQDDGGDGAGLEPVGQAFEVGGAGAEASDGLGVGVGGYGDVVLGGADVDAGGVGVDDGQGLGGRLGAMGAIGWVRHGGLGKKEERAEGVGTSDGATLPNGIRRGPVPTAVAVRPRTSLASGQQAPTLQRSPGPSVRMEDTRNSAPVPCCGTVAEQLAGLANWQTHLRNRLFFRVFSFFRLCQPPTRFGRVANVV